MVYLFLLAAIAVFLMIGLSMMDDRVLPWTCPSCFAGWDDDLLGRYRPWWEARRGDRVRCRTCGSRFRESPNGTLVEDR